jgi:sodium transport system permease protein
VQRVRALVNGYSSQIGSLRLMARGVSPAVAAAIRLEDLEVSSAQQRAARILSFLPFLLVMAAFVGTLQVASDSTAGERERGSLEPLLLNPVPRSAFVAGKWLAAVCFGALSVVFSVLLCTVVLSRIPMQEFGGRFQLNAASYALLVAIVLPLVLFSSALVISVAMMARSYKEAQSYLGILVTLPVLPATAAMALPGLVRVLAPPAPSSSNAPVVIEALWPAVAVVCRVSVLPEARDSAPDTAMAPLPRPWPGPIPFKP